VGYKRARRLASKEFEELSVDEKYAIRYNIVVLVESLVSLCVHVASEGFGLSPSSYREVVRVVAESVGVRSVSDLESVGLRNLLIHRYWGVEDRRVYQSLKANFKCVEEFLGRVERLLG
jgi:uncharacterized protein YutE (UPF0331/DUF86 family)